MKIKRNKREVSFADRDGNVFFSVWPESDDEFIVGGCEVSTILTYREMVKLRDELDRLLTTGKALR